MAVIPLPVSKSIISTTGWGIPITNQVNTNTTDLARLIAQRTNMGWGFVAMATTTTSGSATGTTVIDMPNSSVTFTPVVGRRYRISGVGQLVPNQAGNQGILRIRDSANNTLADFNVAPGAVAGVHAAPWFVTNYASTTPVTLKLSYYVSYGGGTVYLYADGAGNIVRLMVEDIGPVTPVVVP